MSVSQGVECVRGFAPEAPGVHDRRHPCSAVVDHRSVSFEPVVVSASMAWLGLMNEGG